MTDSLHADDAFDFLIKRLAFVPQHPAINDRPGGCNIGIFEIAADYWWGRNGTQTRNMAAPKIDPYHKPFCDAAWRLCLMGVLRPGIVSRSTNVVGGQWFDGDGYSLTAFGYEWVKDAEKRPTPDPSRFGALLRQFDGRLGAGYSDRAAEAVRCHQTGAYLACCVMSGAAAESILLRLAIEKLGDEEKVLSIYRKASGRKHVTDALVGRASEAIAGPFRMALNVIGFWRDEAGHGAHTTISEIEAYGALSHLIRLAQFSIDNWAALTS
jgi:hypothetical protein